MADLPYAAWFAFAQRHMASGPNKMVAELFSGHGAIAHIAERHGFSALQVDLSLPALRRASARRIAADVIALPFKADVFAALLAVNGSLNYLPDAETLADHFAECRRVLCNGGAYVFDFCPAERAHGLHAHTFTALGGSVTFAHRFSPADHQLLTAVQLREADGSVVTELHRQHIFTQAEIKAAAAATGFEIREVCENYALPYDGDYAPMVSCVLIKPA